MSCQNHSGDMAALIWQITLCIQVTRQKAIALPRQLSNKQVYLSVRKYTRAFDELDPRTYTPRRVPCVEPTGYLCLRKTFLTPLS
jgi:hypothetical protein